MSKIRNSVLMVLLAMFAVGLSYARPAAAAGSVPMSFTQQGRLLDKTGAPVDGVELSFTFAIYKSAAGGGNLWTETQSITPDQGYFSARIGEGTPFPAALFDGSQGALFLGITVGSDSEMSPRQQLTSTPFAMLALNALSATDATNAVNATNATTATGALNTRIAALEATVAALSALPKAYAGSFFFTNGTCDVVGSACNISLAAGGFTAAPICTISMWNIDSTGYTEKMVIKNTSATTLSVWKGQLKDVGTTMSGTFVCVGK